MVLLTFSAGSNMILYETNDIEVSISAWVSHAMPLKSIYHFPPTWDFQCSLSSLLEGAGGSDKNDHRFPFLRIVALFEWSLRWAPRNLRDISAVKVETVKLMVGREMSAQIIQMMAFTQIMDILKTSE